MNTINFVKTLAPIAYNLIKDLNTNSTNKSEVVMDRGNSGFSVQQEPFKVDVNVNVYLNVYVNGKQPKMLTGKSYEDQY